MVIAQAPGDPYDQLRYGTLTFYSVHIYIHTETKISVKVLLSNSVRSNAGLPHTAFNVRKVRKLKSRTFSWVVGGSPSCSQ